MVGACGLDAVVHRPAELVAYLLLAPCLGPEQGGPVDAEILLGSKDFGVAGYEDANGKKFGMAVYPDAVRQQDLLFNCTPPAPPVCSPLTRAFTRP